MENKPSIHDWEGDSYPINYFYYPLVFDARLFFYVPKFLTDLTN